MVFFRVQALLLSIYQGLLLAGIAFPIHHMQDVRSVAVLAAFQTSVALFSISIVAFGMFIRDLRSFGRWLLALVWGCFGGVVAFGLSQLVLAALGMRGSLTAAHIAIGIMACAFAIAAYYTCVAFEQYRLQDKSKNPLEAKRKSMTQWLAIILFFLAPLMMNVGGMGIKSLGDRLFHPVAMLIAVVVIWGFATELDEKYNELNT